jgi:hypothetical protein
VEAWMWVVGLLWRSLGEVLVELLLYLVRHAHL